MARETRGGGEDGVISRDERERTMRAREEGEGRINEEEPAENKRWMEREREGESEKGWSRAGGKTADRGKLRGAFLLIPSTRAREMENVRREKSGVARERGRGLGPDREG